MATWIGGNKYLSQSEMETNASYIWTRLKTSGWTKNAVAAMLGNMQSESTINPQIWQNLTQNWDNGYGLVQWTPATKLRDWALSQSLDYTQMDTQLTRLQYEIDNNQQWISTSNYPLTFAQFKASNQTPTYLAMAFLANYERPANPEQPNRGTQAEQWFTKLDGDIPPPLQNNRHKLPVWAMCRRIL